RLLQYGSEVVFLDATQRVTVFRLHRSDPQLTVDVRARGDLSGDPAAGGPLDRSIVGLATAFGLQSLHGHVGSLYIIVKANDAALIASVRSFLAPLAVALALAIVLGILIARLLARQALRPLELAFAQRDRANAAMRQFIADAGHQLRTPLTVVRGFISVLRHPRDESDADRVRILDAMNRQSSIMAALVDKLILLERWESAGGSAEPEPIDVGILVSDLVTAIADANPQRRIAIDAATGLLCAIDPIDLSHVVNNLVDNAMNYTAGDVSVGVRRDDVCAVVDVGDQGPGIAPADAARVFDRFYRGPYRDVEGSGLGLAIAKAAVERARGSIALATSPAGSHFTVKIPLAS
ncbi:MAG TPA: HAMP domain-containing sensor histidine kinase, partial [Candidatus Tumulicola sp.]|nr:HAMP domain-containing sensor histidine kinase [Candidatus Tumulicola sp.]